LASIHFYERAEGNDLGQRKICRAGLSSGFAFLFGFVLLTIFLLGSVGIASAQVPEVDKGAALSTPNTRTGARDCSETVCSAEDKAPGPPSAKTEQPPVAASDVQEQVFLPPKFDIRPEPSARHFPAPPQNSSTQDKFHWKPALIQSGIFLAIQHGFRMTQEKTTSRLGGPFFKDWRYSINIRGWRDSDSAFTNYVAHPMQGSLTGRIFVNNSDKARRQVFGRSKDYWNSRLKAMVWSTAWSIQFEIGPVSEASLGNVGSFKKNGYWTGAWVDFVITPTVGTGVLIGEDMIDKYVLTKWLERKTGGQVTTKVKLYRTFLTPTTAFANLLRWRVPWRRDNRPN
jgi:hypothetical protein